MKTKNVRNFFLLLLVAYLASRNVSAKRRNRNSYLIISNTAIGDALFATPALRLLSDCEPDGKIAVVANLKTKFIFSRNINVDNIFLYNGGWRGFLSVSLLIRRKFNPATAFILNGNEPQATPFAFLCGAAKVYRIPNDKNPFRQYHANNPVARNRYAYSAKSRVDQILLNSKDCCVTADYSLDLECDELKGLGLVESLRVNGDGPVVVVNPVASTNSRMWALQSWAELLLMMKNHLPSPSVFLIGSEKDADYVGEILSNSKSDFATNLCGRLTLEDTACLIRDADLLVTLDTGPLHIAAAMRTPYVAFTVAGNKTMAHRSADDIFLQGIKVCEPCLDKACVDAFCMHQFTPEFIFKKISERLEYVNDANV